MRIILVNNYWYIRGGAERALFATKELLERAGHTVAVFGMQHEQNVYTTDCFAAPVDVMTARGFAKVRSGLSAIYNRDARDRFARLVHDFKPDVIHFHNIYHHLSFSLFDVVKKERIPAVMTLHDYKMINPNYTLFHNGRVDKRGGPGRQYETLLYNTLGSLGKSAIATVEAYMRAWRYPQGAMAYIAPSMFMKRICVDNGLSADTFTVIPNPLAMPATPSRGEEDAERYVLYVGRLSEEKGLHTLLSAAKRTPQIRYVLVGDGPLVGEIRDTIRREHLQNVGLVGQAASDMVEHFVSGAALVVVPSVWYENYPYAILEAKAAGKVVLGSRIGGIPELLPDDCLVEPGNSELLAERITAWLAKTAEERAERGSKYAEEVKKSNDPEQYLSALLGVYEQVK